MIKCAHFSLHWFFRWLYRVCCIVNICILPYILFTLYTDIFMTKLIPVEDHVLVAPVVQETTTASGFILPDSDKEKPSKWTVISVGPGKMLDDGSRSTMDVAEGDVVHFTKYSPDELEIDGETYLIIRHSSILAIEK